MTTSTATRRFRPLRGIAFLAAIVVFSLAGSGVWAYWSAGSGTGGNGVAAATTVGIGAMPTATAVGTSVNLTWAASTLANGSPVSGYLVKRYNATTLVAQTILSSCAGTITTTSCTESAVPAGSWRYSITPVVGTNWSGAESPLSLVTYTDSTLPVNHLSLSNVSGEAGMSGTTIYYQGGAAGSFTVTNALTDTGSGPAASTTSALAGTTTGWIHTPSTVSSPTGGPYVSDTFSWLAGTASSPTDSVTGHDLANNAAVTSVSFVDDVTAPTGTISYATGYQAGRFVTLTFTGADSGSGLASAQLQRSFANFVNGTCQTFGAFSNLGAANPVSPYTDSTVTNSKCYNYRYVLTDLVGNVFTATSTSTAWVDYAGAVRFKTTGIVSQLRLGELTLNGSVTAADSVGSNNAAYSNGVVQGATGELPNDSNTAATLDGVNDYIRAATTSGLPTGASARTVELWFKTTATTQQSLFAYGSLANTEEFGLWIDAGGTTLTAWGWGGANDATFTPSAGVEDGKWHQVVETFSGTAITVYIDGVSLGSQAMTRNTVIDSYGLQIGDVVDPGDGNSGFNFKGSLDEFSIYSAALTQTDVTNHYQLGANTSADSTGPTGGSVTVSGLAGTGGVYSTSTTLNVSLAKGTDASGVASTGALLFRASAPLTSTGTADGVCGTFTSFTLVTTDPSTPFADTVADQTCYAYRYAVPDVLGNFTTYASSSVKVDTTPPVTPTLTFSALSNCDYTAGVLTYNFNGGFFQQNRFTVKMTTTDTTSGIASYTFPTLGTGWSSTGTGNTRTYTFTTNAVASGTETVTATNNAGTNGTATFILAQG
ncbi:MAG TPA: LamG domain-containing protein [Galbitalea sp.]|nr:LamG domain-containing protein [Galbitalea sp.]